MSRPTREQYQELIPYLEKFGFEVIGYDPNFLCNWTGYKRGSCDLPFDAAIRIKELLENERGIRTP